jgi:hypothetical protein
VQYEDCTKLETKHINRRDATLSKNSRFFCFFQYKAKGWDVARKIVVKAERLPDKKDFRGKENTRYGYMRTSAERWMTYQR